MAELEAREKSRLCCRSSQGSGTVSSSPSSGDPRDARILVGDCRRIMPQQGPFDLVIADEPYGDTALPWDKRVTGWLATAHVRLKPTGSLWLFGSMRSLLERGVPSGWRLAQDIVWEKHNGTGFAKDRFKRVHEHVVQFVRADAVWAEVYNDPQRVEHVGPAKTGVKRRQLAHTGKIAASEYVDDGTRLVRSVLKEPSVRHAGRHGTEKPQGLLQTIIRTSCPPGGLVADFFAGSGAVGEACLATGRCYVGTEIDPGMAELARRRLLADGHSKATTGDSPTNGPTP